MQNGILIWDEYTRRWERPYYDVKLHRIIGSIMGRLTSDEAIIYLKVLREAIVIEVTQAVEYSKPDNKTRVVSGPSNPLIKRVLPWNRKPA